MHNFTDYSVEATTKDTFFPKSFEQTWKLEHKYHDQRSSENESYEYPPLNNPILQDKRFNKKCNVCRSIKYSNDGKCVISTHSDFAIRLYITSDRLLTPFNRIFLQDSIICSDLNPGFNLYDERSYQYNLNNIIVSQRQLPLKLISLIANEERDQNNIIGSYHFKDLQNERYFDTYSLKFINENNFVAGSSNVLSIFNTEYYNSIATFKLKTKENNINYGIVSCVENSSDYSSNIDTFYFGTYLNKFSLIDVREGNVILTKDMNPYKVGNGIYQILQRDSYVYVLCRKSNEIAILDKRMDYHLVNKLENWQMNNNEEQIKPLMSMKNNGVITPSGKLVVGNQFGQINIWNLSLSNKSPCKRIQYRDPLTSIGSVTVDPTDESFFTVSSGNMMESSTFNNNRVDILHF